MSLFWDLWVTYAAILYPFEDLRGRVDPTELRTYLASLEASEGFLFFMCLYDTAQSFQATSMY